MTVPHYLSRITALPNRLQAGAVLSAVVAGCRAFRLAVPAVVMELAAENGTPEEFEHEEQQDKPPIKYYKT